MRYSDFIIVNRRDRKPQDVLGAMIRYEVGARGPLSRTADRKLSEKTKCGTCTLTESFGLTRRRSCLPEKQSIKVKADAPV